MKKLIIPFILTYLATAQLAFGAGVEQKFPTDSLTFGVGASATSKILTVNTNDGALNPKLTIPMATKDFNFNKAVKIAANLLRVGDGANVITKVIEFDLGLGASNPKMNFNSVSGEYEFENGTINAKGNLISLGDGTNTNKTIKFNKGASSPEIRYNSATSKIEFSNDAVVYKAIGSGGGGGVGINLLDNKGFEDGISVGWTNSGGTYAAAIAPNILFENVSVAFTASGAGQYFESNAVAVPKILFGLDCMAKIQYAGADANSYLTVMDGASVELIPTTSRLVLSPNGGTKTAKVYFTCPTSGSVKFRVASTAAMVVGYFDEGALGSADFNGASNTIAATPYTPIITGFGTATGVQAFYARRQDMLKVWGAFTAGTTTATQAQIGLPNGLMLDVNKVLNVQRTDLGRVSRAANAVSNGTPSAAAGPYTLISETGSSLTSVFISASTNTTASHYVVALGNALANSGDYMQFNFEVPIAGWSTLENSINSKCPNDVDCENRFDAFVSSAGAVSGENLNWLSGNCSGGAQQTCTLAITGLANPMLCYGTPTENGAASTARVFTPNRTLTTTTQIAWNTHQSGTGNVVSDVNITCVKQGSDFKNKQTIQAFLASTVTSGINNLRIESLFVDNNCNASPCTITSQTGAFTSVTRVGLGQYQANIQAGTFSTIFSCVAMAHSANGNPTYTASDSSPALTTTAFKFRTIRRDTHLEFDERFSIICTGLR